MSEDAAFSEYKTMMAAMLKSRAKDDTSAGELFAPTSSNSELSGRLDACEQDFLLRRFRRAYTSSRGVLDDIAALSPVENKRKVVDKAHTTGNNALKTHVCTGEDCGCVAAFAVALQAMYEINPACDEELTALVARYYGSEQNLPYELFLLVANVWLAQGRLEVLRGLLVEYLTSNQQPRMTKEQASKYYEKKRQDYEYLSTEQYDCVFEMLLFHVLVPLSGRPDCSLLPAQVSSFLSDNQLITPWRKEQFQTRLQHSLPHNVVKTPVPEELPQRAGEAQSTALEHQQPTPQQQQKDQQLQGSSNAAAASRMPYPLRFLLTVVRRLTARYPVGSGFLALLVLLALRRRISDYLAALGDPNKKTALGVLVDLVWYNFASLLKSSSFGRLLF